MTDDVVEAPPNWRTLLDDATSGAGSGVGRTALRAARRLELIAYLSGAFDLAEGEPIGHAARVAYVAHAIAQKLDYDVAGRRRVIAAGLLHDSGVAIRDLPVGFDRSGGHVAAGAWIAERFGLEPAVGIAIRQTHERWDGDGRPLGRVGTEVPETALMVAAAHWVSDETASVQGPLRARARALDRTVERLIPIVGPRVAMATRAVLSMDEVWLDFWSPQVAGAVAAHLAGDGRPSVRTVIDVSRAAGDVIDAALYTPGHAERVAAMAGALARAGGFPTEQVHAIEVAGRLIDIAQIAMPPHTLDKPDILTLPEMERVRQHPMQAARLLEPVPGFATIARWIEYHHVRPDGRGYPDLPPGIVPPVPAAILAVADAYGAMLGDRPFRFASTPAAAAEAIREAAGTQFDATVVGWLPDAVQWLTARAQADAARSANARSGGAPFGGGLVGAAPARGRAPRARRELHAVRPE